MKKRDERRDAEPAGDERLQERVLQEQRGGGRGGGQKRESRSDRGAAVRAAVSQGVAGKPPICGDACRQKRIAVRAHRLAAADTSARHGPTSWRAGNPANARRARRRARDRLP